MKKTFTQKLLIGGFLFVALLVVIMEVVSVGEINILAEKTEKMYRHPLTVSNSILKANSHIISMHRYLKDMALAETATEIELAISRVDEDEKEVYRHFKIVMERFLGDKSIVIGVRKIFSDWKPIRSEVIELARKGDYSAAAAITKGAGSRQIVLITSSMDRLKNFADGKAEEFLSESKVTHSTSIIELRFLMAGLLIAAGIVAFLVIQRVNSIEKNLRDSEGHLRRVQKMEAIGELTGGIAHDFNNILGVISGNLELLRRKVTNDPKAAEYVEEAYGASQRGADVTSKLLGFSRKGSSQSELINLNEAIEGMEGLIAKSLTSSIAVEIHSSDNLWSADINLGDFEDSLLNLSLNARDAIHKGGSLTIETFNKVLDETYAELNPGSMAGEFVLMTVSDTGTGMVPDTIDKVFQPFFTTKEIGEGTGLGLSMVYGFVERSGGHIKIYSELGRGTTVRIYLPRAVKGTGNVKEINANIDLPRGNETVLVVDDEEGLVKVAVSFLEGLGYRTISASNGIQSLELLQEHHQIDLLFSDVVMPGGMDGYDLAKAAIEIYPDLRVLLTSGFTSKRENQVNGDGPLFSKLTKNILDKPYNELELAVSVRRTLDDEN